MVYLKVITPQNINTFTIMEFSVLPIFVSKKLYHYIMDYNLKHLSPCFITDISGQMNGYQSVSYQILTWPVIMLECFYVND